MKFTIIYLNPTLSYRFSPNITKNISDDDQSSRNRKYKLFKNRSSGGVEGGQSATYGLNYQKLNKSGNEKINLIYIKFIE